ERHDHGQSRGGQALSTKPRRTLSRLVLQALLLLPAWAEAGGWYLMAPPYQQRDDARLGGAAAVNSAWQSRAVFDGSEQCEDARRLWRVRTTARMGQLVESNDVPGEKAAEEAVEYFVADLSQCVASDDPRLARPPGPEWHLVLPNGVRVGPYSSAARCEAGRQEGLRLPLDKQWEIRNQGGRVPPKLEQLIRQTRAAKCVAAADL